MNAAAYRAEINKLRFHAGLTLGMAVALLTLPWGAGGDNAPFERKLDAPPLRVASPVLPPAARAYLNDTMPHFRPVEPEDYAPSWFEPDSPWSALKSSYFNWCIHGDFDGNGRTDVALLMRGAVDGGERTRLVVVRSFEGGWSHDILEDYPALSEVRSMIYGVRPGRHAMELADAPNPNWNWIPHASLIMSPLESDGANHYYWDKTGWHKVYVGL